MAPKSSSDLSISFYGLHFLFLIMFIFSFSNVYAGNTPFGINSHIPDQALLEEIKTGDIHWIRCDFNWYIAEPARGQWSFGIFDDLVNSATEKGLRIFPTLGYSPSWSNGGREPNYPPLDPADWENFVYTIVTRYKNKIQCWGMWNEPNLEDFFAGSLEQYLEDILKKGSIAAHRADPDCFVLGPELASINDWHIWMGRVCDDAIGYIDIITHHCYKGNPVELFRYLEGPVWPWEHTLLGELEKHNALNMEIWLTETGWHSDEVGENFQALYYNQTLEMMAKRDYLNKIFFYEVKDDPNISSKWGIVRSDLSHKPAYDSYQDFSRSNEGLHYFLYSRKSPSWRKVSLDGSLDEWEDYASGITLTLHDYYTVSKAPQGTGDIGAEFYSMWSEQGIFIAADVVDDTHHNPYSEELMWQGDGIQVSIDSDNDRTQGSYDTDGDYEYGLALTSGGIKVHRWVAPAGSPSSLATGFVKRLGNRTFYELFIPREEFLPACFSSFGDGTGFDTIGVNIIINDSDGSGREGWLEWTQGTGQLKDPGSYGRLVFKPVASDIILDMTPCHSIVEIPRTGGSFAFSVDITNPAPLEQHLWIWTSALIPRNREISPALGPVAVKISPFSTISFSDVVQKIPASLEQGFSWYRVNVGAKYPQSDISMPLRIFKTGN